MLLSFGAITVVAPMLYIFFPLMDYYRHITYLPVLVKVFFLVMAGFGLDHYLSSEAKDEWFMSPAFIGSALAASILLIDVFVFKGEYGFASESGDIVSYRFHFIALFAVLFMSIYLFRLPTGARARAGRIILVLFIFEIASFNTALFLGMPVKEPSSIARRSFDVKRYQFQSERYEAGIMKRVRPAMSSAMDYVAINKTPLQYSAFYVDPCPGIFLDDSIRIDSVSKGTRDLLTARFGGDVMGLGMRGKLRDTVLNDPVFMHAVGCNSPKLQIVDSPRMVSTLDDAKRLIRDMDDFDTRPVVYTASLEGKVKGVDGFETVENKKGFAGAKHPALAPPGKEEGLYRLSFRQKIGDNLYPFWETADGLPYWLMVRSAVDRTITEYTMVADMEPGIAGRMPSRWVLQASADGEEWTDLDKRSSELYWRPSEERTYKVAAGRPYRYYRFNITRTESRNPLLRIGSIKLNFKEVSRAPMTVTVSTGNFAGEAVPIELSETLPENAYGKITSAGITANTMRVVADVKSPDAWLVYLDNYHPGWKAEVNGRPREIGRANMAFKAVKLEEGHNEISFTFNGNHRTALYMKVFFLIGVMGSIYVIFISLSCLLGRPGMAVPLKAVPLLVAFLACLPIFVMEFGIHNDYSFLVFDRPEHLSFTSILFSFRDESPHLILVGRGINAFLMGVLSVLLDSVAELALVRFVSFVVTVLGAMLMYLFLRRRLAVAPFWAAAAAFGIFSLPSSQAYIIWVTNFVPGSLTVLLSACAYLVFDRAMDVSGLLGHLPSEKAFEGIGRFFNRPVLLGASFVLLIITFMIYPPNAFFFLVFTTARVLFSEFREWPGTRRRFMADVFFCGFTTVVYFAFVRLVMSPIALRVYPDIASRMIEPERYAMSFSMDLIHKAVQFKDMSFIAFGAWFHTQFDQKVAYVVFLSLLAGSLVLLGAHLRRQRRAAREGRAACANPISRTLQMVAAVFALILISNAPILMARGSFTSYRLIYPYCAIAALLIFWCIYSLTGLVIRDPGARLHAISALTVAVILVSASLAASNLYSSALNARRELTFIRGKLMNEMPWNTINVVIVKPPWGSSFVEPVLKHEFNYMATNYNDTPLPNVVIEKEMGWKRKVGVIHLGKRLLMNDLYEDPYKDFYMDDSFRTVEIDDTVFAIDMHEISNSRVRGRYKPFVRKSTSTAKRRWISSAELVKEGYKGFNIVESDGKYFAILQAEGAFDLNKAESGGYSEMVVAENVDEVLDKIDENPNLRNYDYDFYVPTLVEEGYKGFNIVQYAGRLYGIPQGEGAFDPVLIKAKKGYSRLFEGTQVKEVKAQIDMVPRKGRLSRMWHRVAGHFYDNF